MVGPPTGEALPPLGRAGQVGTRRVPFCAVVVSENGLSSRTIRSPRPQIRVMGTWREIIGDPFLWLFGRSVQAPPNHSMKNAIIEVTESA